MSILKKCGIFSCAALLCSTSFAGELKDRVQSLGVDNILFCTRPYRKDEGHWYANFGYYCDSVDRKTYAVGGIAGQLSVFSVKTGKVTHLVSDETGAIRDPQMSYDGTKVLFSYRKGGSDHFHLYTINIDGTNLTQLTSGGYDDIEATYTPDGAIMFISSRSQKWVNCWQTQVGNLFRCNEDGTNMQLISPNVEHDNSPYPLPDGRIIYTRWEYVDRSQLVFHHLWTTNPDGTSQMVYYGNMHPQHVYIDAKPIPGTDRIVCIEAPGHGRQEHGGSVVTLTDANGPDDKSSLKYVAKLPKKEGGARHRGIYRDPFPLAENCFLVSLDNKLVAMDEKGKYEVLYELPEKNEFINEPSPVRARERERLRPDTTNPEMETGKLVLTDVNIGRNMEGVEPGTIKNLLVLETLPKPISYSGLMAPISMGGTFTLERILGKIPVEADGSAHMELPAKRPLFFIALDENDQAVKRMQSFLTVMPGEVTSCVGCHEERTMAPPSKPQLMALQRPASKIEPVTDVPDLYDFPTDIQPIFDKHCVSCHNPTNQKGGVQMTGDIGPIFAHSYYWLSTLNQLGDARNAPKGNYDPYTLGDVASQLMRKIRGGHGKVKMSDEEIKTIQYWLHAGAPYAGSYAALGTGMIGQDLLNHAMGREDLRLPTAMKYQEVIDRRCGECHESVKAKPLPDTDLWPMKPIVAKHAKHKRPLPNSGSDMIQTINRIRADHPQLQYASHITFNLSRPELSKILLAPLAKDAGGLEMCRKLDAKGKATDEVVEVFKDKNDPDFQTMLKFIEEMSEMRHTTHSSWYMDSFKADPAYVREMIRYGVLPATFNIETDELDVYETDEKYFQRHWYKPQK